MDRRPVTTFFTPVPSPPGLGCTDEAISRDPERGCYSVYMLRNVSILAARAIPSSLKEWVHRNRWIDRASRKAFAFLMKANGDTVIIESGPMKGLRLRASEHVSHAHISGSYEIETLEAIDRLVEPGFICYDLGASIGYLSLLMARKAKHVYAFEPAPHAAAEMARQAAVNGFQNITVEPNAVSDQRRKVTFCLTDVAYGSSIVETETKWPTIEVTAITLDEFVQTHPLPDFIKIDVEGEEGRVLRGAGSILAQRHVRICCELHSQHAAEEVQAVLSQYGYKMKTFDGEPFVVTGRIIPGLVQIIATP